MSALFRKEVQEAQRSQGLGEICLATPLSLRWWAVLAAALTTVAVLFLIFGHYTRHETVSGQLVPSEGLLTLSVPTNGIVTNLYVKEGDYVVAGQSLAEISNDQVSAKMGDTHALVSTQLRAQKRELNTTISNLRPQAEVQAESLGNRVDLLQVQIREIDGQLALQRKKTVASENLVRRVKPLLRKGFVSKVNFNRYKDAILANKGQIKALTRQRLDTEQQLNNLQTQLKQLPLDTDAKASKLRRQLAQLDVQLAGNEAASGIVLRASRAGIISSLLSKAGQNVVAGQKLLSILPKGSNLEAQVLVPSSAIGFIEIGNRVKLRYQAYPYQKFGQQFGSVIQISHSILSPSEVSSLLGKNVDAPSYRLIVALDHQHINAYGKIEALKPGMALQADIVLGHDSLAQWIFAPLRGLNQRLARQGG